MAEDEQSPAETEQHAILEDKVTTNIALACALATVTISVFQICQHLRHYTEPSFQRYIIRIIFIVPCYGAASYLALSYRDWSMWFETPRDCYEAWVIYNFMSLCMAYVGGPGAVVVKSEGKIIKPSWILCTCCMKPIPVDGFFLRNCKQGTLQFVIAKPILALITLILFECGKYQIGDWSFDSGYLYIAIIYNVCYTLALFWMLLFYVGCEELLEPYRPLFKFACFKAVIFLTFWQSLVIAFLAPRFHLDPDNSEALQNWIIVVEMFLASLGMLVAFPWSEYTIGGQASGWRWGNVAHALSIMDVLSDVIHQFNPSYKKYVLYHNGGPADNVKMNEYRGKNKQKDKDASQFSGVTSIMTHMSKPFNNKKMNRINLDEEANGDEEGAQWYGLDSEKPGLMSRVLARGNPQQLIAWIPGITEQERHQAELLGSDSADDEEGSMDGNQIDGALLCSSSSGGSFFQASQRPPSVNGGTNGAHMPHTNSTPDMGPFGRGSGYGGATTPPYGTITPAAIAPEVQMALMEAAFGAAATKKEAGPAAVPQPPASSIPVAVPVKLPDAPTVSSAAAAPLPMLAPPRTSANPLPPMPLPVLQAPPKPQVLPAAVVAAATAAAAQVVAPDAVEAAVAAASKAVADSMVVAGVADHNGVADSKAAPPPGGQAAAAHPSTSPDTAPPAPGAQAAQKQQPDAGAQDAGGAAATASPVKSSGAPVPLLAPPPRATGPKVPALAPPPKARATPAASTTSASTPQPAPPAPPPANGVAEVAAAAADSPTKPAVDSSPAEEGSPTKAGLPAAVTSEEVESPAKGGLTAAGAAEGESPAQPADTAAEGGSSAQPADTAAGATATAAAPDEADARQSPADAPSTAVEEAEGAVATKEAGSRD